MKSVILREFINSKVKVVTGQENRMILVPVCVTFSNSMSHDN